jgi:hypothetical protein
LNSIYKQKKQSSEAKFAFAKVKTENQTWKTSLFII